MKKFLTALIVLAVLAVSPLMFTACAIGDTSIEKVVYTDDLQPGINLAMQSSVVVTGNSAGSGVIYKIDGNTMYVITNWHVICTDAKSDFTPSENYSVSPAGVKKWIVNSGKNYYVTDSEYSWNMPSVSLVGGSVYYDIAILKIVDTEGFIDRFSLREAKVADYKDGKYTVAYGDAVFAVGNSLDAGISATEGRVSIASEYTEGTGVGGTIRTVLRRVIRTSAATQQGNSGGGLYNASGELIGITQSKTMYYGTSTQYPADNIAYAIPVDIAGRIAEQMVRRDNGTGAPIPTGNPDDKDCLIEKVVGIVTKSTNLRNVTDSDGNYRLIEDVSVDSVTAQLQTPLLSDDLLVSVTCGGQTINIQNHYQIKELLIECWNETDISFQIRRSGTKMNITGELIVMPS